VLWWLLWLLLWDSGAGYDIDFLLFYEDEAELGAFAGDIHCGEAHALCGSSGELQAEDFAMLFPDYIG